MYNKKINKLLETKSLQQEQALLVKHASARPSTQEVPFPVRADL